MSDDQEFLEELKREFIQEALFLAEQCEESYLKLESADNVSDQLAKIFRLAHSIKGGSMAVGLTEMSAFAHSVEDFLSILRVEPSLVSPAAISLLLQAGDQLKLMLSLAMEERSIEDRGAHEALLGKIRQATQVAQSSLPAVEAAAANGQGPALEVPVAKTPSLRKSDIELVEFTPADAAPTAEAAPRDPQPVSDESGGVGDRPKGSGSAAKAVVKVETARIESILDLVGEIVILKSQLLHGFTTELKVGSQTTSIASLFDKTIRELQDMTLSMRMTALKPLFVKLQRTIRDVSLRLNKKVDIEMFGETTEIDRNMVEALSDPLMHIVRNAIDHGLEPNDERQAKGKPATGRITIKAYQKSSRVIIEVQDDGRGIHRDKILQKAVKSGLISSLDEGQSLSDQQVFDILMRPGFSTAAQVSDISGRGVGLDVVKTTLEGLKGQLTISSKPELGTTFTISLPLTTSIADGLIVTINEERFIFPLERIRELSEFSSENVVAIKQDQEALQLQGRVLPFVRSREILSLSERRDVAPGETVAASPKKVVVIVEHQAGDVAIEVDAIIGQSQVVLKPLGQGFESYRFLSGSAIMGDGRIALVVDIDEMVDGLVHSPSEAAMRTAVGSAYESHG